MPSVCATATRVRVVRGGGVSATVFFFFKNNCWITFVQRPCAHTHTHTHIAIHPSANPTPRITGADTTCAHSHSSRGGGVGGEEDRDQSGLAKGGEGWWGRRGWKEVGGGGGGESSGQYTRLSSGRGTRWIQQPSPNPHHHHPLSFHLLLPPSPFCCTPSLCHVPSPLPPPLCSETLGPCVWVGDTNSRELEKNNNDKKNSIPIVSQTTLSLLSIGGQTKIPHTHTPPTPHPPFLPSSTPPTPPHTATHLCTLQEDSLDNSGKSAVGGEGEQ